jgi:hypothetical protein
MLLSQNGQFDRVAKPGVETSISLPISNKIPSGGPNLMRTSTMPTSLGGLPYNNEPRSSSWHSVGNLQRLAKDAELGD